MSILLMIFLNVFLVFNILAKLCFCANEDNDKDNEIMKYTTSDEWREYIFSSRFNGDKIRSDLHIIKKVEMMCKEIGLNIDLEPLKKSKKEELAEINKKTAIAMQERSKYINSD
ncbi:hypothetical protein SLOPH_1170 [Spraguea lophii 42_110]|uniref:Uncharacterized protein n=1 Tax=Spraguea lophii (strain 42_110) TaxID=1358809 RepID=S7W6G9_SPRLO|nr:hypothetical protein SLOPH_1170 [Spraguea lophii 42_110]